MFPKSKEEDLLEIKFRDENVLQIHFWKFFTQSKYLQDKYKYSEAFCSIQSEIDDFEQQLNISEESIKHFVKLIEDDKINIPVELYKDIYSLSEYFRISKITSELDNINERELFQDLNFTIQILHDSEASNDRLETKLISKIENFLREEINDCFRNSKFGELSVSTIFRILNNFKGKFDQNLLLDFIFESAETRFVLFKLVELYKLSENKVGEIIQFIEKQEETVKKMYLEFMPFNLSFIKDLKNKYDQLFNEMKQIKQELDQTKIKYGQRDLELNQTRKELDQTKIKYGQKDLELNQTRKELDQTKIKYRQKDLELNQTKINHEQAKQELDKCKRELKQAKDALSQTKIKNKQSIQSILVVGRDTDNQLGEKPNTKDKDGTQIIFPPMKLSIDHSSILSYSIYSYHSVMVMSDGSLKGIGDNSDGQISANLQKTVIDHFTDFCIKDSRGRQLAAISAVCYFSGTLYMFSKSNGSGRQLVLCDDDINEGAPVFLDIGNHHPVSLFGGFSHSAAIGSEGEVIFINRHSVEDLLNSPIDGVSLPDGEKASSVACCENSVFVLSSNGRVFTSPVPTESSVLKFSPVSELADKEIVCVSGTYEHCLAVSKEGRVFGCGSNEHGKLGLGKRTKSVSSFKEISSLARYKIIAAYAGWDHSLFQTQEGKILSCGCNEFGELLLSSGPSKDVYYSPTETTITSGASFCIAASYLSVVFTGGPPPNGPNTPVQQLQ